MEFEKEKIQTIAIDVIREVGERIGQELESGDFEVHRKAANDLVTEVDVWAEKKIIETVRKCFPSHVVLGEETSEVLTQEQGKSFAEILNENICWVVDPIDGTTNFVNRIPHVAVSVGILNHGERVLGFILDPMRNELFSAARGEGAYCNGKKIQVSSQSKLSDAIIAVGVYHDRLQNWRRYQPSNEAYLRTSRDLRRFGSAALDQCWVANGRFDGYFEYKLKPWDVAAGSLIVEEAGGVSLNPLSPQGAFDVTSYPFLFSGPNLLEEMVSVFQSVHQEEEED